MRRLTALALVAVLVVSAMPAVAHDPSTELDQVKKELDELDDLIHASKSASSQVAEDLAAATADLDRALEEVAKAQAEVDAKQAEVDLVQAEVDRLTSRLKDVENSLAQTRARLAGTEAELEERVGIMYMDATSASDLLVWIGAEGADFTVSVAYADRLASLSRDLVNTFEVLKRDEERQQDELVTTRSQLDVELVELNSQKEKLLADLAEVEAIRHDAEDEMLAAQALLRKIKDEIARYEEHKDNLEEDAARLQRELARRQSSEGTNPGILAWPVNGPVTSPFGYRIHPIFGTRKLHTGIDISASSGTPIKAAGSGTVLIAGSYGGYGNAVVIDHGGGLATLYAHQSKVAVSVGQTVSTGQVIGYVGCTGYCTGPHLHFETRENGVPVDPMKYLS